MTPSRGQVSWVPACVEHEIPPSCFVCTWVVGAGGGVCGGEGAGARRCSMPSLAASLPRLQGPRSFHTGCGPVGLCPSLPVLVLVLVFKHFQWENSHAEMPRANAWWLLRMFWIFKQEWYLGWISIWLLLLLEFLLHFQKASSFLFPMRYFLWFLCFCGQMYDEGSQ